MDRHGAVSRTGRRARGLRWAPLTLGLLLMTSYASAAAPTKETPAAEDPLAAVGAKLQEGQERFDIADYEGAVEVWSEAYLSLAEVPDSAAYRSVLAYQIATACREAYKVGRDIKYLRRAERLLAQYVETLDPDEEEARASANEA
ncbi:MAG: hypothetical protein KC636_29075, partial [Myxococcales bacterium]|nr:hypothetical protein [Myxococcales bacterium]